MRVLGEAQYMGLWSLIGNREVRMGNDEAEDYRGPYSPEWLNRIPSNSVVAL